MVDPLNILLWGALLGGSFAAGTAWVGRYRALPSFLTGPNVCKLEAGGCQVLFRTKNAALLSIPNSLLGLFFYPLLGVGLLADWPLALLFSASTFSFLMTLWLAWVLVRDRLECRICWTGHFCNTVLWILLLDRLLA